jgi:hypothetical protein
MLEFAAQPSRIEGTVGPPHALQVDRHGVLTPLRHQGLDERAGIVESLVVVDAPVPCGAVVQGRQKMAEGREL